MIGKLNSTNGRILLNSTNGIIRLGDPGMTSAPTINFVGFTTPSGSPSRSNAQFTVTNNDSWSAVVFTDVKVGISPVYTSAGTIASGATTSTITDGNFVVFSGTLVDIYAYAVASGKQASSVEVLTVEYV